MRALLWFVSCALVACGDAGPTSAPAPLEAVPGDMCGEHGVLESVCTLCNPKLATIFRAKGDWCAEHGLPESFCPTCHPERGGRPSVELTPVEPVLDGTEIVLRSAQAVRAAAIEVVEAAEPGPHTLELTGRLVHDARRRAQVNPRATGVVEELLVEVGSQVERGTPLARIQSPEVAGLVVALAAARARETLAQASLERVQSLAAKGLASERERLEAEFALAEGRAAVAMADSALSLLELEPGENGRYLLRAPLAGMVVACSGAVGRLVDHEEILYEIVDASLLWVELDVPERDLGGLAAGHELELTLDGIAGSSRVTTIDHLASEIDVHTRTAKVRARLENADGALRANQLVRARLTLATDGARALVPLESLQTSGEIELVFEELGPGRFRARRVHSGARRGLSIAILEGLEPGTRVATRGSFLLKTEVLKGSIGAGCCEVD